MNLDDDEKVVNFGKALASPVRVQILRMINNNYKPSIAELSRDLKIPASSTAMHVRALLQADLIRIEEQPGTRGQQKLCVINADSVNLHLNETTNSTNSISTVEMPVGEYTNCKVYPTCGLADADGIILMDDDKQAFYMPEHISAQMLWTAKGFVEYTFPNQLSMHKKCKLNSVFFSAEICSEVPGFQEDWKSDITLWINGNDCGTWTSPGDFGERKGRNTPETWLKGRTQYGLLTTWEINHEGCFINNEKVSDKGIEKLNIMGNEYIMVRIGNKEDAKYVGGFNIFGNGFGDYKQDLLLSFVYDEGDWEIHE